MPPAAVVEQLVARVRPELEKLFQRDWVSEEEAEELLDEALLSLVMQWGRLGDPSLWLVGVVDRAIQRRLLIPLFHPPC